MLRSLLLQTRTEGSARRELAFEVMLSLSQFSSSTLISSSIFIFLPLLHSPALSHFPFHYSPSLFSFFHFSQIYLFLFPLVSPSLSNILLALFLFLSYLLFLPPFLFLSSSFSVPQSSISPPSFHIFFLFPLFPVYPLSLFSYFNVLVYPNS